MHFPRAKIKVEVEVKFEDPRATSRGPQWYGKAVQCATSAFASQLGIAPLR